MYNPKNIIYIIIALVVLVGGGFLLSRSHGDAPYPLSGDEAVVTNFDECRAAGYPVSASFPSQCRTPDGRLFVETDSDSTTATASTATGGCFIGGCSAQLCSDQKDAITDCEFRPEYACYQTGGTCERQTDGTCGWRQTSALVACLNVDYDRTPAKK